MYNDFKFHEDDEEEHHNHDPELEKKEDLLEATVGSFGRWQFLISFCMALLKLPIAWIQLGIVFLAPPTDFWCRAPEDYRKLYTREKWIELIKPGNASSYEGNSARCVMRNIELPSDSWALQPCKWGMDYDRSIFETNIISEWNLVCGKEHFVDLTQAILMFGILVGSAFFGILADKFGRKIILMICIAMQAVCGLLSAWSPWISVFLALRFFMAMANGGTMIVSFVICMETVGGKWRGIVPILYQIPFGLGNTLMALVAYYIRTWREFQITLSLMSGLFIVYAWIIPESPRWLLAMDRRKEACEILEKAAEMNNIDVMRVRSRFLETRRFKKPDTTPGFLALVQTPTLRKRTLILSSSWFMSGLTLYGFTQYLGHLGTNIYFNVSVGGLITIPGTLLGVYIISKCGRKWTILFTNLLIAACFISIWMIPSQVFQNDWPKVIFAALGVIGLSVATPTLYLFTGELYPTVMRNVGVGACITFSRVGSMISPFVVSLGQSMTFLPLVILATCAAMQSLLILPLSDSGDNLAETISDVEMGPTAFADQKDSHDDCLYGPEPDENPIIH